MLKNGFLTFCCAFIPGAGHRLLTLVTCSYEWDNARTVVVAVQK